MNKPARLLTPHHLARVVRWATTMLAWLALAMFSETLGVNRRHIRQRYRFVSLDWIERLVRALVIIRTIEITGIKKRPRPVLRNVAPAGFRRRIKRAGARATMGARLRKALKHRDPRERLQRLMAALADIDAFARRYFIPRALKRLTKFNAVVMFAPSADAVALSPRPRWTLLTRHNPRALPPEFSPRRTRVRRGRRRAFLASRFDRLSVTPIQAPALQ